MRRSGQAGAGLRSTAIDLTPLLDVIFLFLFIMVLSNASSVRKLREEAAAEAEASGRKQAALEQEIETLKGQQAAADARLSAAQQTIQELEEQLRGEAAIEAAYQERLQEFEGSVIGRRVKILTIHCSYSPEEPSVRLLRVLAPEGELGLLEFDSSREENAFSQLSAWLDSYILRYGNNEQKTERVVIVLSVNTEGILYRDKLRIHQLIEKLEERYQDVY